MGGSLDEVDSADSVGSPGSRGPGYLEEIGSLVLTPEPRSPKEKDDSAPTPAEEAGCGGVAVLDGEEAAHFRRKGRRRARRLDYEEWLLQEKAKDKDMLLEEAPRVEGAALEARTWAHAQCVERVRSQGGRNDSNESSGVDDMD